jgi:hypothetical protein
MRDWQVLMPHDHGDNRGLSSTKIGLQPSLLRTRISTIYPAEPIGKDYAFRCEAEEGGTYHCKNDNSGRIVRATEWISQSLASHLGIAVPEFRVIEDKEGVETFFGSQDVCSTAGLFEVRDYLTRNHFNEVGAPNDWLGRWLSGLYALDMFLNNPDRGVNNFVLEQTNNLRAIDFADAHLEDITSDRFPVATSNTVCNGKFVENFHRFFLDSALEMIENIRVIPVSVIDGIIGGMPNEWMLDDQKSQISGAWAEGRFNKRLAALRSGLEDGSRR